VAEWFKAPVLKTDEWKRSVSSNLTSPASYTLIRLVWFKSLGLGPRNRRFESYIRDQLYSVRLSVRTQDFHSCKRGSTPLQSTICWPIVKWLSLRILIPSFPVRVRIGLPKVRIVGRVVKATDC